MLSIGTSFRYVIPSFEVLAVALRQIQIRCELDGEDRVYDLFIRSDNSLNGEVLPALMIVKDYTVIQVNT